MSVLDAPRALSLSGSSGGTTSSISVKQKSPQSSQANSMPQADLRVGQRAAVVELGRQSRRISTVTGSDGRLDSGHGPDYSQVPGHQVLSGSSGTHTGYTIPIPSTSASRLQVRRD